MSLSKPHSVGNQVERRRPRPILAANRLDERLTAILQALPYLVKDREGVERFAKLTAATVIEAEKAACCAFAFDTGESIVVNLPMSDSELQAYKEYPDTFFGVLTSAHRALQSPLELCDFLFAAYKQTPKE